jgi:hypothetical protein
LRSSPHVARPAVGEEGRPDLIVESLHGFSVLLRKLPQEGPRQKGYIVLALPQGGDVDVHDVQPVVQILPERAFFDLRLEIPDSSRR